MKTNFWLSICLLIIGINTAMAVVPVGMREPYIDTTAKQYDEMRQQAYGIANTVCIKKFKNNLSKQLDCIDDEMTDSPKRSYPDYNKKTYGTLSKAEADKVLTKLSKITTKARNVSRFNREIGEITLEDLEQEGHWIQKNIFGRAPTLVFEPFRLSNGELLIEFYNANLGTNK